MKAGRKPGDRYRVAVDFDGVLHSYTTPWVAPHVIPDPPVEGALEWLAMLSLRFDVIIFTTRARTWRGRRAIRRWIEKWASAKTGHKGHLDLSEFTITDRKVAAMVYIDDRAFRFQGPGRGNFPDADALHRLRPWNKPKASSAGGIY